MGIVETAKKCLGRVKYVLGANQINSDGSGKADCSSYTMWVFAQNGVNIGRNTEAQLGKGKEVSKNEIQPGDLVFFKDTYASNYKDGVSHVGIYIGNSEFIHNSSGKGCVTISSLKAAYYQSHYLTAKRVTDADGDDLDNIDVGADEEEQGKAGDTDKDTELSFLGDILLLIITLIVGGTGIVFFLKAFGVNIPDPKKILKGGIA